MDTTLHQRQGTRCRLVVQGQAIIVAQTKCPVCILRAIAEECEAARPYIKAVPDAAPLFEERTP